MRKSSRERWVEPFEKPLVRTAAGLTLATFLLLTYSWLNRNLSPKVDLLLPLDEAIPFLPWTLLIYQSMYLLFVVALLTADGKAFLQMSGALLLVALISYCGFALFTSHYPRPDPAVVTAPWLRAQYEWLFVADPPGNTFPSMHVGTTTVVTIRLRTRKLAPLYVIWALLICMSTLTVKQHFIADVLGGWVVAGVVAGGIIAYNRRRDAQR